MTDWPAPVTLEGQHAALVPLSQDHCADLQRATAEGGLHRLWYTTVPDAPGMAAEIARRRALSTMRPFAVVDRATGHAIGMTSYMHIDAPNRRLEIGSTWIGTAAQRTAINTECKLMLLRHAFEALDCIAVEFRTHFMNQQSRRAIERLGAKLDGVLRSHMILPDGSLRDTAVYSVTAAEWPAVRANLTARLARPDT